MGQTLIQYLEMGAVCTLLFVMVLGFLAWWWGREDASVKKFAAAKGIAYRRDGKLPIAIPKVSYGDQHIRETTTWLLGPWNGVEVFACDVRIAEKVRDKNHTWMLFVAVHAELHGTSGLDTETWKVWPLEDWTFLVLRKREGGTRITISTVTELWDALTAAASSANPKVEGTT